MLSQERDITLTHIARSKAIGLNTLYSAGLSFGMMLNIFWHDYSQVSDVTGFQCHSIHLLEILFDQWPFTPQRSTHDAQQIIQSLILPCKFVPNGVLAKSLL